MAEVASSANPTKMALSHLLVAADHAKSSTFNGVKREGRSTISKVSLGLKYCEEHMVHPHRCTSTIPLDSTLKDHLKADEEFLHPGLPFYLLKTSMHTSSVHNSD